jgi:hypothetical protein
LRTLCPTVRKNGHFCPHSAPGVSTIAYTPPNCTQPWTLAGRFRALSIHLCVHLRRLYANVDRYARVHNGSVPIHSSLQAPRKGGRLPRRPRPRWRA